MPETTATPAAIGIERGAWRWRWRLLFAWAGLVAVLLLIRVARYTGIVGVLGEWQFGQLYRYFPVVTMMLIILLLTLPVWLVLVLIQRRRVARAARGQNDAILLPVAQEHSITAARRFEWFFWIVALAALPVAAEAGWQLWSLPPATGAERTIVVADVSPNGYQGPARLVGAVDLERIALLRDRLLFAERVIYVAPVLPPGGEGPARYFTTVRPVNAKATRFAPIGSGVLLSDGVPHELLSLYRGLGVTTAEQAALLLPDAAAMQWRYWMAIIQALVVAVVAAVFGLLARRSRRRLVATLEEAADLSPA